MLATDTKKLNNLEGIGNKIIPFELIPVSKNIKKTDSFLNFFANTQQQPNIPNANEVLSNWGVPATSIEIGGTSRTSSEGKDRFFMETYTNNDPTKIIDDFQTTHLLYENKMWVSLLFTVGAMKENIRRFNYIKGRVHKPEVFIGPEGTVYPGTSYSTDVISVKPFRFGAGSQIDIRMFKTQHGSELVWRFYTDMQMALYEFFLKQQIKAAWTVQNGYNAFKPNPVSTDIMYDLEQYLLNKIQRFDILNRQKNGLELLVTHADQDMGIYAANANIIILPSQIVYNKYRPENLEKINASIKGGKTDLTEGGYYLDKDSIEGMIKGKKIYRATSYQDTSDDKKKDFTSETKAFGEFLAADTSKEIGIYSEHTDSIESLDFKSFFKKSGLFDEKNKGYAYSPDIKKVSSMLYNKFSDSDPFYIKNKTNSFPVPFIGGIKDSMEKSYKLMITSLYDTSNIIGNKKENTLSKISKNSSKKRKLASLQEIMTGDTTNYISDEFYMQTDRYDFRGSGVSHPVKYFKRKVDNEETKYLNFSELFYTEEINNCLETMEKIDNILLTETFSPLFNDINNFKIFDNFFYKTISPPSMFFYKDKLKNFVTAVEPTSRLFVYHIGNMGANITNSLNALDGTTKLVNTVALKDTSLTGGVVQSTLMANTAKYVNKIDLNNATVKSNTTPYEELFKDNMFAGTTIVGLNALLTAFIGNNFNIQAKSNIGQLAKKVMMNNNKKEVWLYIIADAIKQLVCLGDPKNTGKELLLFDSGIPALIQAYNTKFGKDDDRFMEAGDITNPNHKGYMNVIFTSIQYKILFSKNIYDTVNYGVYKDHLDKLGLENKIDVKYLKDDSFDDAVDAAACNGDVYAVNVSSYMNTITAMFINKIIASGPNNIKVNSFYNPEFISFLINITIPISEEVKMTTEEKQIVKDLFLSDKTVFDLNTFIGKLDTTFSNVVDKKVMGCDNLLTYKNLVQSEWKILTERINNDTEELIKTRDEMEKYFNYIKKYSTGNIVQNISNTPKYTNVQVTEERLKEYFTNKDIQARWELPNANNLCDPCINSTDRAIWYNAYLKRDILNGLIGNVKKLSLIKTPYVSFFEKSDTGDRKNTPVIKNIDKNFYWLKIYDDTIKKRFNELYDEIISNGNKCPIVLGLMKLFMFTPFKLNVILGFLTNNIYSPISTLMIRKDMIYKTFGILITGYLGEAYFGNFESYRGSKIQGLLHMGVSAKGAIAIIHGENAYKISDVSVFEGFGGTGTLFYDGNKQHSESIYYNAKTNTFGLKESYKPSIICVCITNKDCDNLKNKSFIDVLGTYDSLFTDMSIQSKKSLIELETVNPPFSSCYRFCNLWGYNKVGDVSPSLKKNNAMLITPNTICYRMNEFIKKKNGSYILTRSGCGHFGGEYSISGAKKKRIGLEIKGF